jgi:tetratricopeptide (TPR) repeat protein
MIEDLGTNLVGTMRVASQLGFVEDLLGEYDRAESVMRPAVELLDKAGEKSFLSTLAPSLGCVLARVGRLDEAEPMARLGRETAPEDDWASQVEWRQATGWVLAGRGRLEEAEAVLREAIDMFEGHDLVNQMAQVWTDLAHVLDLAGRDEEAAEARRGSLRLYEAKGNVVGAAAVRAALERAGG